MPRDRPPRQTAHHVLLVRPAGLFGRGTQLRGKVDFDGKTVVVLGEDVGVNGGVFRATVGLQQRFGDAGHGFHLLAKPNASYIHKAIEFRGGDDWSRCWPIAVTLPKKYRASASTRGNWNSCSVAMARSARRRISCCRR